MSICVAVITMRSTESVIPKTTKEDPLGAERKTPEDADRAARIEEEVRQNEDESPCYEQ